MRPYGKEALGLPYSQPFSTEETVHLDLAELSRVVRAHFDVLDTYFDEYGVPNFLVNHAPTKQKFKDLLNELRDANLTAAVRSRSDKLLIKIFQKPQTRASNPMINLVLMFVTMGTILFASYTLAQSIDSEVLRTVFGGVNLNAQILIFAASLFGIIALHESGHKMMAMVHRMDSTSPYFIPGPPPFGTFGAVISLKSPPANRDELFDLGFSGPVVGFAVTVLVAILSILSAPLVPQAEVQRLVGQGLLSMQEWPRTPLIMILLNYAGMRTVPTGQVLVLTQVAFAAEIGALITFLNIIPAWQLDGGHIMRATFGPRGHRIATLIGIGALTLTGYWIFAILILILMFVRGGMTGVEPLDDVSALSKSRKVLFGVALLMLILCFMVF